MFFYFLFVCPDVHAKAGFWYQFRFLKQYHTGRWDLFQKAAIPMNRDSWNAPKPEIGGSVQAGKTNVATEIVFWGLSASGRLSCDAF
jgi:hypothetical protein